MNWRPPLPPTTFPPVTNRAESVSISSSTREKAQHGIASSGATLAASSRTRLGISSTSTLAIAPFSSSRRSDRNIEPAAAGRREKRHGPTTRRVLWQGRVLQASKLVDMAKLRGVLAYTGDRAFGASNGESLFALASGKSKNEASAELMLFNFCLIHFLNLCDMAIVTTSTSRLPPAAIGDWPRDERWISSDVCAPVPSQK